MTATQVIFYFLLLSAIVFALLHIGLNKIIYLDKTYIPYNSRRLKKVKNAYIGDYDDIAVYYYNNKLYVLDNMGHGYHLREVGEQCYRYFKILGKEMDKWRFHHIIGKH